MYAKVDISKYEPQNSIVLKDALNEAILEHFKASLSNEENAISKIYVKLTNVDFAEIDYDINGYVVGYKTTVKLQTKYIQSNDKKHFIKTDGSYYFRVNPNSIISDNDRYEALKKASLKALSELKHKIILLGSKK